MAENNRLTQTELDGIRARAEKVNDVDCQDCIEAQRNIADFSTHAREDVPKLLAEVERLTGVIGSLVSSLELIVEQTEGRPQAIAKGAISYGAEIFE